MISSDGERIVLETPSSGALAVVLPGSCARCRASVVRARRGPAGNPEGAVVLLEVGSPVRVGPAPGRMLVQVSPAGHVQVVDPLLFKVHVCDPQFILNGLGGYTPEVLSVTCPVDSCNATIDEYCISPREEVIHHPHGARVALANNNPWTEAPIPTTRIDDE